MHMPRPCLAFLAWAALWCSSAASQTAIADINYVVQPGDHLWNIAQRYMQQPSQALAVARSNGIANPKRLRPGTLLRIPAAWLREQPEPVRVLAVSGEVEVQPAGGPARAAHAGDTLQAPARLTTGTQGSASLGFADGSRALLLRSSELHVHGSSTRLLDQAGTVSLQLLRGSLENDVLPLADPGRRFEIRMPAAVAAVRGTRFRVHSVGTGQRAEARTEVLAGAVRLASPFGAVLAQAGQGSLAPSDAPPEPPMQLLPSPATDGLPVQVEYLPAAWNFATLAGATAYRVQLARDAGFSAVVLDLHLPTAQLQLPGQRELSDGCYWLRVRGIDAHGLEGHSAQQRLRVWTQPAPPLMLEPAVDAQLGQGRPQFRWTDSAGNAGYRLQLFRQDDVAPRLDVRTDRGQYLPTHDLPPGRYRWRVAGVGHDGTEGPFGEAQHFVRAEPGPQATLGTVDNAAVLRWTPQAGAAGYQVQVAPVTGPATMAQQLQVDGPQWQLAPLQPGTYQVRVRVIGADGVTGPWGQAENFEVPEPPRPHWPKLLLLLPLVLL